jgi:dienelactone hydrolase
VSRQRVALVTIGVVACLGVVLLLRPQLHGLTFVVRAADMHGALRTIADLDARPVEEAAVDIGGSAISIGAGPMQGRLYQPRSRPRRLVLLVSGLHPAGIAEPRLVSLARQLATAGLAVVTPEIRDLSRFEITPAITDGIEAAAIWLAERAAASSATTTDGRIGLIGISFSGGLSIVAAGRPAVKDRVAWVLSFGGHDDLPRVLRYLCTGIEPLPPGQLGLGLKRTGNQVAAPAVFARPPHDYALAVILLGVADRLVPASQVDRLRDAVRKFLSSSTEERIDRTQAEQGYAELRDLATRLPEPSSTLLRYLNDRDVAHLGARLLPYIGAYGTAPALSPSKSSRPAAPVFLLHGSEDNVVPTIEAEYLAAGLRGRVPVRVLVSELVSHAEVDARPKVGDVLQLASFWGDLLVR